MAQGPGALRFGCGQETCPRPSAEPPPRAHTARRGLMGWPRRRGAGLRSVALRPPPIPRSTRVPEPGQASTGESEGGVI